MVKLSSLKGEVKCAPGWIVTMYLPNEKLNVSPVDASNDFHSELLVRSAPYEMDARRVKHRNVMIVSLRYFLMVNKNYTKVPVCCLPWAKYSIAREILKG
jgi:hypothetical protein